MENYYVNLKQEPWLTGLTPLTVKQRLHLFLLRGV
jgi:hypothetical protein